MATKPKTPPTIPWSKPNPVLVKIVLRNLRDQLKAQHEKKQSAPKGRG